MDWLRSLFAPDPTRGWTADRPDPLTFDFDRFELIGARVGDPIDRLSRLGPAEDRAAAKKGRLCYPSLGLEILSDEGRITGIGIYWAAKFHPSCRPFLGRCTLRGRELPLHEPLTENRLREWFGEPHDHDADEEEVVLVFRSTSRGVEWDVCLGADGRLRELAVYPLE
jgi:hypothetical protein